MKTTLKRIITATALLLCIQASAGMIKPAGHSADWDHINWTGCTTLGQIGNAPLVVGDKVFSNFTLENKMDRNGLALACAPDELNIYTGEFHKDGEIYYGLHLAGSWKAGALPHASAQIESRITYQVSVRAEPELDPMYISGSRFQMHLSRYGTLGGYSASATQQIYDAHTGQALYDGLLTEAERGPAEADFDFAVKAAYVETDLLLQVEDCETGLVHLTGTTHTFAQVPEPATLGMLAAGAFVLHGLRRSIRT